MRDFPRRSGLVALFFCLSALLIPHATRAAGQGEGEAALRALAAQYYDAISREDLTAIRALWSEKSPHNWARDDRLAVIFLAYDGIEAQSREFGEFSMSGGEASLRVKIVYRATNVKTKAATTALFVADRTIEWRREEGQWRVWREGSPALVTLSEAVIKAAADASPRALLDARAEMQTVELWEDVNYRNLALYRDDQLSPAVTVYGLLAELAARLGYPQGQFRALTSLGLTHSQLGNLVLTLDSYQQALQLGEDLREVANVARLHNNLGTFYQVQGDLDLALLHCARSVEMMRSVKEIHENGRWYATALNSLGVTYRLMGRNEDALRAHQEALAEARSAAARGASYADAVVAATLTRIGAIHLDVGRYTEARAALEQSMRLREQLETASGMAETASYLALLEAHTGRLPRAIEYAEPSVSLARESKVRSLLWRALATAGHLYRLARDYDKSEQALAEAVKTVEETRARVAGDEEDRQRFLQRLLEAKVSAYVEMVELYLDQGQAWRALAQAERAKARVLLDVLKNNRTNLARVMTADERAEEQRLGREMAEMNRAILRERQWPQPDSALLSRLEERRSRARLSYKEFQGRVYTKHAEALIREEAATPLTEAHVAALLPEKGALLEFVTTTADTYLFVMTGGAASKGGPAGPVLKVHRLGVSASDLAARVNDFRGRLARRDLQFREPARELYRLLLGPAQAQLVDVSSLVIVPDGALWELPFQALLTSSGRYVWEEADIVYAPSLTVLRDAAAIRRPSAVSDEATLLAFGNPSLVVDAKGEWLAAASLSSGAGGGRLGPLPHAEEEVNAIQRQYGPARSRVFVGAAATERVVKSEIGRHGILHFATHGVIDNEAPMYSHILLSQANALGNEDGLLEAREVINLDLKTDLVVLSACETARGRVGAGEGVIGLSWAFWLAGCPTTVVSQWKVESRSTAALMADFYRRLGGLPGRGWHGSRPVAAALRGAALELMRSEEYRHPFYWAGFVVMGSAIK